MDDLTRLILEGAAQGKIDKELAKKILTGILKNDAEKPGHDIAIIGMAIKFPMADTLQELWNILGQGQDCIRNYPESRQKDSELLRLFYSTEWNARVTYPDGGYLARVDEFDYRFFHISPKEASLMDPSQRLFLQTAYLAMEDAGYGGGKLNGTRTGIYLGAKGSPTYGQYIQNVEPESQSLSMPGNVSSVIAARVAYLFDFKGPSMMIDTACSSSLVAVHKACQGLKCNECDLAIAGGVKINLLPFEVSHIMDSQDYRTRSFDDNANGAAWGEGVAAILLKPLEKAVKDRDAIYAVIKGGAINQDGKTMGISAPNALAQADVLVAAWEDAGIHPETLSYIEAHGTGTSLGDPIEIDGIQKAFRKFTSKKQFCAIGSIKTNLGHLDTSSGIAGLIKAVLALQHQQLPPSLHFQKSNRNIKFRRSPVYLNDRLALWEDTDTPRRCGVSSFGFSGTNCHLVLEEAPPKIREPKRILSQGPMVFTISAESEAILATFITNYREFLENNQNLELGDLCYTANTGRGHYSFRLAFIVDDLAGLRNRLAGINLESVKQQAGARLFYGESHIIYQEREIKTDHDLTPNEIRSLTQTANGKINEYLAATDGRDQILAQICQLYVQGAVIDWELFYRDQIWFKLNIPGYPFEKVRCWLEVAPERIQYCQELASGRQSYALAKAEPSVVEEIGAFLTPKTVAPENGMEEPEFNFAAVEEYGLLLLLKTFQRMGVLKKANEHYTVEDLIHKIGLIDKYRRFFDAVLEMLETKGKFIKRDGQQIQVTKQVATAAITQKLSALDSLRESLSKENPPAIHVIQLLQLCITNYPDILTGKAPAASILFSDKADELVANIYRGNSGAYLNEMAACGIACGIHKLVEIRAQFSKQSLPAIRILELGAGIGATTARVLEEVYGSGVPMECIEYYYTDISLSFVNYGQNTFGNKYPFLVFEKLDLEKDLESQGFQSNSFDIILAANVIHATRNIKHSLRQIKQLLKSRGLLFLIEVTKMQEFSTLTFGTLDGWWLSEDQELRLHNSPMLSREMWAAVLRDGFAGVKDYANEAGNQVLILAENGAPVEINRTNNQYSSLGKLTGRLKQVRQVAIKGRKDGDYTNTEKIVARIWGEVLGFEAIDIYDNFFELGGDSIIASKVINMANERLRIRAKVADLLQNLSVKAFAQFITGSYLAAKGEADYYTTIKPAPEEEFYPVSSAQKRQFILNQLARNDTNYNIPVATLISGPINRPRIESAFRELIERHESLRTSFALVNEEPKQKIHPQVDFQIEYLEMADDGGDRTGMPVPHDIIQQLIRPFNLEHAPLIRAFLIKITDEKHILLFDMSHIIADGTSLGIIVKELAYTYAGLDLPQLEIQYKDFALWQNEALQSAVMKKQAQFWLETFQGEIPVLNLPTDFPRPPVQVFEGARIGAPVPPEVITGLNRLVVKTESSLYMILLAAYQVLLYKYSGQQDIIIGSPIAGRSHAQLENIVGMFANTLAMRNYLEPEQRFVDFLARVKDNTLKAYDNQEYQFEELIGGLNLQRDLSRNPLFDVMFALQNMENPEIAIHDLKFAPYELENKTSKFDLTLEVVQFQQNMTINFEYSDRLFKKATVRRMADHFQNIIHQILQEPELNIVAIDMLSNFEKEQLLFQFNQTRLDYPAEKTIHALFEEQVTRTPEQIALQIKDTLLTYRELDEKASKIAKILLNKGVKPDCPVGILVNRSLEMMIGIMGVLKAGAAYLPIDPEYPDERIKYMLEDSKTTILLTQRHLRERGGFDGKILVLDDEQLYQGTVTVLEKTTTARNLAYIIYTSGSTGKPKGVMIEHGAVNNFIHGITQRIDFAAHKSILALTTISFDIFGLETLLPLTRGLKVIIATKEQQRDSRLLSDLIINNHIDMVQLTPSRLQLLLSSGEGLSCLANLTEIMIGGEALPESLLSMVRNSTHAKIYNMYGPTETTIWSTVKEVTADTKINIGTPIANTQVYILNSFYQLQPIGVAGELCIAGDGLARGYWERPELTAEKFVSNPFFGGSDGIPVETLHASPPAEGQSLQESPQRIYRTGDLARWLPDGNIEFLGRIDHQVKIRGFRIELGEIEAQLLKHKTVKELAVIVQEASDGSKFLCAYFTGKQQLTVHELRLFLAESLPDYMIPSYFVQLNTMPQTPNGKVDRKALPAFYQHQESTRSYAGPQNTAEAQLAEIWQEVLGIPRVGMNDNFFELGGHSLKATVLTSKVHKVFDIELPLPEVFKNPTVREQVEYLSQAVPKVYLSLEPVTAWPSYPDNCFPVSSAQKRLYILNEIEGAGTSYNMPGGAIIEGRLDRAKLEAAFLELIRRHEAFRTSFELIGGEPAQRINSAVDFKVHYQKTDEASLEGTICDFIQPFNLSQAPLLRVCLLELLPQKHILIYDMHHIICDGVSMRILIQELMALYGGHHLPKLRIQYKDFAVWQNELFKSGRIKEQEEYWLRRFSDKLPLLNLPEDFPRPAQQSFEGSRIEFEAGLEILKQLQQLNLKTGTTLYMVLLAAYNILLAKYTGRADIIVGSPSAGRPHADMENIIGMFVNTLAMRNYPADHKQVLEFLGEVKFNSLQAYANQDYQFEELIEKLNLERDLSRNPLFDVMFVLQNQLEDSDKDIDTHGLSFKPYPLEIKTAKFDLWLSATKTNRGVRFILEYCSKIYKKTTAERLAGHFLNILQSITATPETKIAALEMMSVAEKRQILHDFNGAQTPNPENQTIHQLFEYQASLTPDKIAVVFGNQQLTYAELSFRANRIANYLRNQGVQPGSLVGIMMERSVDMAVAIFGVLKAGGAYVPMDCDYPEERLKTIINDAQCRIILSTKKHLKRLNKLQWECPRFDVYLCMDSADIYAEIEPQKNELMDKSLWNFVGDNAKDRIAGGGWVDSYTGQDFSSAEMDEYASNVFQKLKPYLHQNARVLEIGCASGITMYQIAPCVGFYYGTDLSEVIIRRNQQKIIEEGIGNIRLKSLAAHEIDKLEESDFDIIIMNSVVHCFHGHNYLRNVMVKAIHLLKNQGIFFIGDILDQRLKTDFIRSLLEFKQKNAGFGYRSKTDFSAELFVDHDFFTDLRVNLPEISRIDYSGKIHTLENELTRYRYDTLLTIDKSQVGQTVPAQKRKYQHDLRQLTDSSKPDGLGVSPRGAAYVIYTSGSTGKPKGVMIEHHSVINRLLWMQHKYQLTPDDRILQKTPYTFDVSVWELFWWSWAGASVCFLEPNAEKDPNAIVTAIEKYQITTLHFVPSMLHAFLDFVEVQNLTGKLKSLRRVFASGEALSLPLVKKFQQVIHRRLDVQLHNLYGPTEATVDVSYFDCFESPEPELIPIGKPIDNIRLYIVDSNYQPQPVGIPGELWIAGAGVGRGYLNQPELTAEKFVSNSFQRETPQRIYRTGDLARWLPDGNIEFLGRIDHQVKIRGFRIELDEIENHLLGYESVQETVVITRKDSGGNQYLCAYFVGGRETTAAEIKDYLALKLPDYMIPAYFIRLDRMPLSANGKLDRKALPEPEVMIPGGGDYQAPRTETERRLAGIFRDILGIQRIGIHDNFFELGGHSLKAIQLISAVYKEFEVELPLREVFNTPSIAELAQYITSRGASMYAAIETAPISEYYPPGCYPASSAQKRMYILQQMEKDSIGYNMPGIGILEGNVNRERLENAFKALVKRHEAYRTSFRLMNGEPVQQIDPELDFQINYSEAAETEMEGTIKAFIRPFDLGTAPLLRVSLVHLSDTKSLLMYDMHHIISDGLSMNILNREFIRLYQGEVLPELRLQYKDYTIWQIGFLKTGVIKQQEQYWLSAFSGKIPTLNIQTDYPRPLKRSFQGDTVSFQLNREITQGLQQIGLECGTTLFMILLAAYNVMLSRYCGQEDIIVGSPIVGRRHPDLENIIGMFVNMIALRNYPASAKTFRQFLVEVKDNALTAYENQDYPFDELVPKIDIAKDISRNPLCDTVFAMENIAPPSIRIADLTYIPHPYDDQITKFDLLLTANEVHDSMMMRFQYSTALFKKRTVERLSKYFVDVINQVIANPDLRIGAIKLGDSLLTAKSNIATDIEDDFSF